MCYFCGRMGYIIDVCKSKFQVYKVELLGFLQVDFILDLVDLFLVVIYNFSVEGICIEIFVELNGYFFFMELDMGV